VRYRLRKMEEAAPLATGHPDQRLALIVALAAMDEERA
jgi:DNA-binding PucR family transcriptional regulator